MEEHEKGYFTEKDSAEVVIGRNKNGKDERLKDVMAVITRKLHEAVKEIEPTQEEWLQAIMFLTQTGQKCTDWRQEFILLSDTLGVSMLVDAIKITVSRLVRQRAPCWDPSMSKTLPSCRSAPTSASTTRASRW
jgi:Catechol dioxygenase N terminus